MKNILQNSDKALEKKINWETIQNAMREKFGDDIFESWIKKIELEEEYNNYILFSVSTRFIRDWIYQDILIKYCKLLRIIKRIF